MYLKSRIKLWRLLRRHRENLRLNLGCGGDYRQGFINIDYGVNATVDVHLDFQNLQRFFSLESITEVMMIHSLGYLNLWQARDLFRQILALLKSGGRLIVETPDMMQCAHK